MSNNNWLDKLSEILSQPLPGTETKSQAPPETPVVFTDDDDDESLLDKITDVLSKPFPGNEGPLDDNSSGRSATPAEPENPGETAVRDAEQPNADPVSTTASAGADWMQREYERFNAHQERNRQAFMLQQQTEQERFAAYQRTQLQRFTRSQERERGVFRQHQEARFRMWRDDLQRTFGPYPAAGQRPSAPPPPPPWWRRGR
jgi:hypothetical protein